MTLFRVGQYWNGQGGIYAGIMREAELTWHVIMPISTASEFSSRWSNNTTNLEGKFSFTDGFYNSKLVAQADPSNPVLKKLSFLNIEGHSDFYWPSKGELCLIAHNLPEFLSPEYHWSSTQLSPMKAWAHGMDTGCQYHFEKQTRLAVRAVRRITIA